MTRAVAALRLLRRAFHARAVAAHDDGRLERGGRGRPHPLPHRQESPVRRVWFIRPQRHWYGAAALLPLYVGGDEYDRRTIVLGWTVTGRVVVALWRDWNLPTPFHPEV